MIPSRGVFMKSMSVRGIVVAVVLAAFVALPSLAAGEDVTLGMQIAQQAAFPIFSSPQAPSFGCTAFYLSPALATDSEVTSVVMSAGHCFLEGQTYYRRDARGVWHKMLPIVATEASGYDSAIAVTTDLPGAVPGYVGPARTDLHEGDTVVSYGFPGSVPRATTGTFTGWGEIVISQDPAGNASWNVQDCTSPTYENCFMLIQTDQPTIGGQSGSPVLDTQGRLIGIVVYRISDGGLMGVTPISHVSVNYGAAPMRRR
jgi:hypothetical protein